MKESAKALLNSFQRFHKLNMQSIFPNISGFEHGTLAAIYKCNQKGDTIDGEVKVSDVSACLNVNPTQVSRTLKGLEERELVERTVNKKDRRITYVQLTEEGSKTLEECTAIIDDFSDRVFSQIDEEEIEHITTFLSDMYVIIEREIKSRKYDRKKQ